MKYLYLILFLILVNLNCSKSPGIKYNRHTFSLDGCVGFPNAGVLCTKVNSTLMSIDKSKSFFFKYFMPSVCYRFQLGKYGGFLSQLGFGYVTNLNGSDGSLALFIDFGGFLDIAKIPVLRHIDIFLEYISPCAWIFKAFKLFDTKSRKTLWGIILGPYIRFDGGKVGLSVKPTYNTYLKHGFYYFFDITNLNFTFGKDFNIDKLSKRKKDKRRKCFK